MAAEGPSRRFKRPGMLPSDFPRQNGTPFSVGRNGNRSCRTILFTQETGLAILKIGNDRTLLIIGTQHILRAVGNAATAANTLVVIYMTNAHYIFSPSFLAAAMEA